MEGLTSINIQSLYDSLCDCPCQELSPPRQVFKGQIRKFAVCPSRLNCCHKPCLLSSILCPLFRLSLHISTSSPSRLFPRMPPPSLHQDRPPVIEPFSPPDLIPECPARTPSVSRYTLEQRHWVQMIFFVCQYCEWFDHNNTVCVYSDSYWAFSTEHVLSMMP